MIARWLAIALATLSVLASANDGCARADDLRYVIVPSTGMIVEGRFSGNQLISARIAGQATRVRLRDGKSYWWSPQTGLPPVPINVPEPGFSVPAPTDEGVTGSPVPSRSPQQLGPDQRRWRIQQIDEQIRRLERMIRDQDKSIQFIQEQLDRNPSSISMSAGLSSAQARRRINEDRKMELEMEKARLESEP